MQSYEEDLREGSTPTGAASGGGGALVMIPVTGSHFRLISPLSCLAPQTAVGDGVPLGLRMTMDAFVKDVLYKVGLQPKYGS
jgi:hypothetical protein